MLFSFVVSLSAQFKEVAKRKVLNVRDDFSATLFGVVTQLKDYQLSWHINKEFKFDLKRMDDIEVINKKKSKTAIFSLYRYEDDLDKCIVYII